MARKEVIVSGRDAEGGLSKEEEAAAKKAMDESTNTAISARGGTDIPRTEQSEETRKQKEADAKLAQRQEEFAQKQAQRIADASPTGEAPAIPLKQGQNTNDCKWVRLLRNYVPETGYYVMEGESVVYKSATPGRVLDKVQAQSVIGLPSAEAGRVLKKDLQLAERADDL